MTPNKKVDTDPPKRSSKPKPVREVDDVVVVRRPPPQVYEPSGPPVSIGIGIGVGGFGGGGYGGGGHGGGGNYGGAPVGTRRGY